MRTRLLGLVLSLIAVSLAGCNNNIRYNAKRNADLRHFELVPAETSNAPYQAPLFYSEGDLPYDDGGEVAAGAAAGATLGFLSIFLFPPAGLAIAGGSMMAASVAGMAVVDAVESKRSKVLQSTLIGFDVRGEFHSAFATKFQSYGYTTEGGSLVPAGTTLADKQDFEDEESATKVQQRFPSMSRALRKAHETKADATIVADVVGYGLFKRVVPFKTDRFVPFIAVQVTAFRTDNDKIVHRQFYLRIMEPDQAPFGDLDATLQNRAFLVEELSALARAIGEQAAIDFAPYQQSEN